MPYHSVNPYDGTVFKTSEQLTDQQLESALDTAANCFETWRHTTFASRAAVAAKAAAIMRARADEVARLVTLEMGKLIDQARGEVALSADIIDYYAQNRTWLEVLWGEENRPHRVGGMRCAGCLSALRSLAQQLRSEALA